MHEHISTCPRKKPARKTHKRAFKVDQSTWASRRIKSWSDTTIRCPIGWLENLRKARCIALHRVARSRKAKQFCTTRLDCKVSISGNFGCRSICPEGRMIVWEWRSLGFLHPRGLESLTNAIGNAMKSICFKFWVPMSVEKWKLSWQVTGYILPTFRNQQRSHLDLKDLYISRVVPLAERISGCGHVSFMCWNSSLSVPIV